MRLARHLIRVKFLNTHTGKIFGATWLPAAMLGFAMMAIIQTGTPYLPGNDGFYHVKMAELLPELGFPRTFPWLRWTILNDHFVSHHYGFHVLLLPFVFAAKVLGYESGFGGKFAACVASGATLGLFDWIVRRRGAPFPLLWAIFFAVVPWHYWLRMGFVRAPMAALPLLLLAVQWNLRPRGWAIFGLAFVFTQIYGGAILFPLIAGGFFFAAVLCGDGVKRNAWALAAASLGLVLGMIISPFFPANISFFKTQVFTTGLGAARDVGGEWKPYETWAFLIQAAPVAVIWTVCLTLRLRAAERASRTELALFFINLMFLVLTFKARRFVEYWPAFALLNAAEFAAVAWRAPRSVRFADLQLPLALSTALTAVVLGSWNLWQVWMDQRPTYDVPAVRGAMEFLEANSPSGSLVFTDDWDIFPICFYFNHHNTYAVGLDPEFTRTRYPSLWERYKRITRAELPAKLPREFRDDEETSDIEYEDIGTIFGAKYVLVADDHAKLYRALSDRPESFEQIYPPKSGQQAKMTVFKYLPK